MSVFVINSRALPGGEVGRGSGPGLKQKTSSKGMAS